MIRSTSYWSRKIGPPQRFLFQREVLTVLTKSGTIGNNPWLDDIFGEVQTEGVVMAVKGRIVQQKLLVESSFHVSRKPNIFLLFFLVRDFK
jgi:hypothetical protein